MRNRPSLFRQFNLAEANGGTRLRGDRLAREVAVRDLNRVLARRAGQRVELEIAERVCFGRRDGLIFEKKCDLGAVDAFHCAVGLAYNASADKISRGAI